MEDLQSLLAIERFAETLSRQEDYVDMTGDLLSGILLGQIVYWHLPSKDGRSKLRVQKEGKLWLAKGRADWYDEIRITPKQFDRAIKILVEQGFHRDEAVQVRRITDGPYPSPPGTCHRFRFSPKGQNPF